VTTAGPVAYQSGGTPPDPELAALVARPDVRDALASRRIFNREADLVAALEPPTRDGLRTLAGCEHALVVYVGQQVAVDLAPSVVAKIVELSRLVGAHDELAPVLVWADTDRAGADNGTATIGWNDGVRLPGISVAARAKHRETRHVPVDPDALQRAVDKVGTYLFATMSDVGTRRRYRRLRDAFSADEVMWLSEFDRRLCHFLFQECLQFDPPSVFVSTLMSEGCLTGPLNGLLNALPDVISVFNEERSTFIGRGIDPRLKPLDADYLPLKWSCEADFSRLALRHEIVGGDHFAAAVCRCGLPVRLHLGSRRIDTTELIESGRVSPDVTLPLLLNDLVSGVVLGRSSARYGLVLNGVVERVFERKPTPGLIPGVLREPAPVGRRAGLIQDYVMGGWCAGRD
jgi:hypothetical protein